MRDDPDRPHASPYRSARLVAEEAPRPRRRVAYTLAVVGALSALASALCFKRPRPVVVVVAAGDRVAEGSPVEHATWLSSGVGEGVVVVTRNEFGNREVLRTGERVVERGTDLALAPAVFAVRDVERVVGNGVAVDRNGYFYQLGVRGAVRGVDLPFDASHGRVVDLAPKPAHVYGPHLVARMADGNVQMLTRSRQWRDVSTPPTAARRLAGMGDLVCAIVTDGRVHCWEHRWLAAPDDEAGARQRDVGADVVHLALADADELALSPPGRDNPNLACVRGAGGAVACAVIHPSADGHTPLSSEPVALVGASGAATGVFVGARDLCTLDRDGTARCAWGPERDPPGALDAGGITLHRAPSLDGAAQIAFAEGLGCARWPAGVVRCWGPVARGGAVFERRAPVEVPGLDAAERLIVGDGRWCALQRGALVCREAPAAGRYDDRGASAAPVTVTMPEPVTAAAFFGNEVCALSRSGRVVCVARNGARRTLNTPHARSIAAVDSRVCVLDEGSRAWCGVQENAYEPMRPFARVAAFDGVTRLATLHFHDCAWADDGPMRCVPSRGAAAEPIEASEFDGTRDAVAVIEESCALLRNGSLSCGRETMRETLPPTLLASLGGALRTGSGHHDKLCVVGVNGLVACERHTQDERGVTVREAPALVPGLERIEEVIDVGATCARRADGHVLCWGWNTLNLLTEAESARAPRLVPLRR